MSSRINIARPQPANSYNVDPNGLGNSRGFGGGPYQSSSPAPNPDDPFLKIKQIASKIEDLIDIYSQPLRPHLGSIGRFLIVVTFLEDSWRITTQWSDQCWYLEKHRHFPKFFSNLFLFLNVITMITCAPAVILKRYSEFAVCGLLAVVIVQGFGYGLIFDLNFFLRNLSVVGGLLMVFSDSMTSRKAIFAGLPSLSENDRRKYFQLAGRILLIFLFIGFILQGQWSIARVFVSIVGLAACIMVAIGFKAKWSAAFLVIVLSIFNVFINNWWSIHSAHPQRDFLKYDFFQTLSIVGGLLLLVNMGPGGLSVDEKKKEY
ncbi:SURF4-domain-containing protein [Sistotremastrum niveocremeum HHB9708]|uniref:SURF4-domain-containing protein n=2 Tax=Sistotremastraceae TaxID=3402574 RepID=A0A164YUK6_9AGAM|nr:SURF4-domain-containing protein [Sistotremastrum niveocremeum HHB9708]KZT34078.1 SURF4-domain-containing protein [Sistotremastrum suecicum HHB10207 ss-3]